MLLVCKIVDNIQIDKTLSSRLAQSAYFASLDLKEDGARFQLKPPVIFDTSEGFKIQSQIRIRFLLVPECIFDRFLKSASCLASNSPPQSLNHWCSHTELEGWEGQSLD